jgi:hypothetical protein
VIEVSCLCQLSRKNCILRLFVLRVARTVAPGLIQRVSIFSFTVLLRWDSLFLLVLLFHPGMSLRSINLLPLINEDTAPWNYPPEFQNFLKIQHLQCVIYHLTECFEPLIHMTKSSQIEGASVMLLHADMSANLTLHL